MAVDQEFLRKMQIQAGIVPAGQEPAVEAEASPTPSWALKQAYKQRLLVGGEEGRMAMFPDEYANKPIPKQDETGARIDPKAYLDPRAYWAERGARGILTGIVQMIPASMTLVGGILDFAGDDDAGEAVAGAGMSMEEWLAEHVAVENPQFGDHLMAGVGSMLSFMVPGVGVAGAAGKAAQGLQLAGKAAKAFKAVTGGGAMSFLEAAVEQSQRQQELMSQGIEPGEALEQSKGVFWKNLALLGLTNIPLWSPGHRVLRALITSPSEAVQERAQGVIQDVAAGRGEWSDFLDPEKYGTDTAVGALVGGGAALVMPGDSGGPSEEDTGQPDEQPAPRPFEDEAPAGWETFPEPVLRGPSEVPGGPPVGQTQQPEQGVEQPAGEPGAPATERKTPSMVASELVDKGEYTTIQALGRLEEATEAELGRQVDFAAELSHGQQVHLVQLVEKAENLNSEGKLEEAWVAADQAISWAKSMLEGKKKAEPKPAPGIETFKGTAQAEAAPEAKAKPAPKTPVKAAPVEKKKPEGLAHKETAKTLKTAAEKKKGTRVTGLLGSHVMPLSDINLDPARLQKREGADPVTGVYNEDLVEDAIDNFDPTSVADIVVWKDPKDGKYYALDGHHTRAILEGVGTNEAQVKEFLGTEAEAIEAAKLYNTRRRDFDIFSMVSQVRDLRAAPGATRASVSVEAKKRFQKNSGRAIFWSHLNPKGQLMGSLRAMEKGTEDSAGDLRKIASWIGRIRQKHSALTDAHEQEMYDYLRDSLGKRGMKNVQDFSRFIDNKVMVLGFNPREALNLKSAVSRTPAQQSYDRQVREAEREVKRTIDEKEAKRKSLINKKTPKKVLDGVLAKYDDAITIAQRELLEIKQRKGDTKASNTGEQSLFSILPADRQNFIEEKRAMLSDGLITDAGITPSPMSPHARNIEGLMKRWGRKVVWFKADPKPGSGQVGGWYSTDTGTVFLNRSLKDHPVLPVAMHEVTHHMETKHHDLWWDFYDVIVKNLAPGAYKMFESQVTGIKGGNYNKGKIPGELAARMMEEVAAKDSFWRDLKARNPRAFSTVLNKLLDVLRSIRNMFLKSPSYGGLEAYTKDFGAIERAAAKAMATMSEREFGTEPAPGPKGQGSLFSITPSESYMKEKLDRLKRTEKGIRNRWRREGPGGIGRLIYEKMVDQKTWLYVRTRNALKAMGKNWYEFDVSKNPYYIQRMMLGWAKKAEWAINHGVYSWDGKTRISDSFIQIVKKYGLASDIESGEFGMFAMAARLKAMHDTLGDSFFGGKTQERQDSLFNEGMSDQERASREEFAKEEQLYEEYKDRSYTDPKTGEKRTWEQAVGEFSDFSDAVMKRLVQSGMISEKMYRQMVDKYDIYAPLFVLEKETPLAGKPAYEMNQLIPGLVRMDPMQGMVKNVYRLEMLNAQNQTKKAAADFVIRMTGGTPSLKGYGRRVVSSGNPLQDYVEKLKSAAALSGEQDAETELALESVAKLYATAEFQDENVISFMRDGEIEYWQFDPDIHAAFTGDSEFLNHPIIKLITHQTKILRAGAVLTPEFMVRNQWRDFQSAAILATTLVNNPKDAFMLPTRLIQAVGMIAKKKDAYKDFIMSGTGYANMVSLDQPTLKKELDQVLRSSGIDYKAQKFLQSPVKYSLHTHPLTMLQTMSSAIENVTRLAVREKVKSDLLAEGFSEEEASARATIQGREASTDFGRAGAYGKIINRFLPFFNASVQGHDKMVRTLVRDPDTRKGAWVKGFLLLTVPTIALWLENHDKEWYDDKPLWMKNHFWLFSHDNGKNVWMLPKPFDVGLLFASLPERFLDWLVDDDPEAMKSWAETVKDDVIPNDISVMMGPMLASMNEARANYDNFRDTPIVKGYLQKVAPSEQYTATTSEFAKWVGDLGPGRGWSPLKIDHVIRGTFGGLGRWGADIASELVMAADPKRKERKPSSKLLYDQIPDWMPIIRGVARVGPTMYTRDKNDFYEQYRKSSEAYNTLRFHAAAGMKEKYLEAYQEMGVDLELYESVRRFSEVLGKISKQVRAIQYADPEVLSRDEKRQKIDKLTVQSNNLVREYMKKLRTIDLDEMQEKIDASVSRIEREWEESRR